LNTNEIAQKVELECDDANISGDVLSHSIIDTNTLNIDGTTHIDSTQFAKYAKINTHKGVLRCHEATINLLDNGEVHATTVIVDTATGGSIYAQDVKIKHITDNVNIYASNSIDIELISGNNNKLYIDYEEVPILVSKIDLIKDDVQELELSFKKAKRDNSSLEKDISNEMLRLKIELEKIENSSKTAKISIQKPLQGSATISFNIDDENQIVFETKKEKYSTFELEITQNKVTLHPTQQTITLNS